MNNVRLQSLAVLTIAGSLALAGCSGDEDNNTNNTNNTIPDSGVVDTPDSGDMTNNGGMDAGMGGMDAMMPPSPCPIGTEGCACTSNLGPDDTAFLQDDCEADLLCIPFDLISQRTDLTGPLQSCVKPCSTDADCGTGQTCAASGFAEETGAAFICTDRIAQYDEFCGFSRGLISRVPDIDLETRGEIVGCPDGVTCARFGFVHPDEGICLNFCEDDSECTGLNLPNGDFDYCNPNVFTTGSTGTIGTCSLNKIGQGGLCGTEGFSRRCDTADDATPNLACFGTPGLPEDTGLCVALCNATDEPCRPLDEGGGEQSCVLTPDVFNPASAFRGLCGSSCTGNFPDTCTGMGSEGVGSYCAGPFAFPDSDSFTFCADRSTPVFNAGDFNSQGQAADLGDDCIVNGEAFSYRCPEPAFCLDDGTRGICIVGCTQTSSAPGTLCTDLLMSETATCANPGIFNEPFGLCGDDG